MIDFLAANWPWIGFAGLMLVMHRHGGCGMHHGHSHGQSQAHTHGGDEPSADRSETTTPATSGSSRHEH